MAWRVEVFAPKIREFTVSPFSGVKTFITKPLFPRYIFARFAVNDLLHKVCFTRGVNNVVQFGNVPAPVDETIISLLKSRIDKDGFIKTSEDLKSGDMVVIDDGPLKNFTGIFERELPDHERISILLTTVSYQSRILLDRDKVRRIYQAA
jgi:transcriptional antiterminator RfaH